MQSHAETAFHHSAGVIPDDWASDSNGSGRSTSSFVLLPASTAKERGIPDVSLILNKSHSGTRSSPGFAVAEDHLNEWNGKAILPQAPDVFMESMPPCWDGEHNVDICNQEDCGPIRSGPCT